MKRIRLTQQQLDEVIRLRQTGLSFLKIEDQMKSSGVTRRVAQRAYREWEEARSVRELANVRVKVGEIEFEKHIDALTSFSVHLVEHIVLPEYYECNCNAEIYFSSLMERDIIDMPGYQAAALTEDRKRWHAKRSNLLLFESLKVHTADIIDWNLLKSWMEGWDTCHLSFPSFSQLVSKAVQDAYTPFPDPDLWITGSYNLEKLLEMLEKELLHVLWKGIVEGEIKTALSMIISRDAGQDGVSRPRVTVGGHTFVQNSGDELNSSFIDRCRDIVTLVWGHDETCDLLAASGQMRDVIGTLEEKLEPLVLRPHLIRTRCRICPA